MQFRGREISHLDLGLEFLNHLVDGDDGVRHAGIAIRSARVV